MDLITSRIYISWHVVFDENVFPYQIPQPPPIPTISPQTFSPSIPSFTSNSHTSTTSKTFHPGNMPSSPTNSSSSYQPIPLVIQVPFIANSLTPLLLGHLLEGCNNHILFESARVVSNIVQVSRLSC